MLWVGWFGFNPGSVLAFNNEAMVVVITTFLAAAACLLSTMVCAYVVSKHEEDLHLLYAVNGILMGLIIITPLAGFVSPASSVILGLCGGPPFLVAERFFSRFTWFSDPCGLLPGHLVGGLFGVSMIAFFAERQFATASGFPKLPNGLFFGGGGRAVHQLGVELLGIVTVTALVFVLSFATAALLTRLPRRHHRRLPRSDPTRRRRSGCASRRSSSGSSGRAGTHVGASSRDGLRGPRRKGGSSSPCLISTCPTVHCRLGLRGPATERDRCTGLR